MRSHFAASREVAKEAIERVFAEASGKPARSSEPVKRTAGRRRPSEEVAALGEQFYAAVCEKPGETMMVLAHEVGMTPGELKVPVGRLRRSGRLRCVGRKSHMRYFPMVGEAKADKEVAA